MLQWVDFIPEGDAELRRQIAEYNTQMKTDIRLETINANDLQARITSSIESQTARDIIMMLHNWPHLYQSALAEVSDLCEWKEREQGSYYVQSEAAARESKRWLALPYGIVPGLVAFRKSREFLKWLHGKEQFGKWFEIESGYSVGATVYWENHPMWKAVDDALKPFRTAARGSRMIGYAGPPSGKATEVYSKYIITDMYAKAVQGLAAADAVGWATHELKQIYEA